MINQILASIAAALFVGDLHTTSEILKKGTNGKEENGALAFLNDKSKPWHRRFWALAAIKGASIAAVVYTGFTQTHEYVPYVLCALDLVYGYIVIVNNLPIYSKLKK